MSESSDWPYNSTFTTCDKYTEENKPKRINFDLRKYFKQVFIYEFKLEFVRNEFAIQLLIILKYLYLIYLFTLT